AARPPGTRGAIPRPRAPAPGSRAPPRRASHPGRAGGRSPSSAAHSPVRGGHPFAASPSSSLSLVSSFLSSVQRNRDRPRINLPPPLVALRDALTLAIVLY